MERAMNDNSNMRVEKFFHRLVVGISAALILYGIILAGTMVYGTYQSQHKVPGDPNFQALVDEQNSQDEAFPQMHAVPVFGNAKTGGDVSALTNMNAVSEEQKDDLTLPLFDPNAESGSSGGKEMEEEP